MPITEENTSKTSDDLGTLVTVIKTLTDEVSSLRHTI